MLYEEHKAYYYIDRMIDQACIDEEEMDRNLFWWGKRFGLFAPSVKKTSKGQRGIARKNGKLLRKEIAKRAVMPTQNIKKGNLAENFFFLIKVFDLNEWEVRWLEFLTFSKQVEILHSFIERFGSSGFTRNFQIQRICNFSYQEMEKLNKRSGKLWRFGLLRRSRFAREEVDISDMLSDFLQGSYENEKDMSRALIGPMMDENWQPKNFAYIAETDLAVKIIRAAGKEPGCNILLYGTPGTGKTCFAQMLARAAKRNLYTVGEERDDDLDEENNRLEALYRKQILLEKDTSACLLFDEAEDIFFNRRARFTKVEINRLLETNKCPIIWTTNNIQSMDPAFIRRFTLAIHFQKPPVEIRRQIWKKSLRENAIHITGKEVSSLAEKYSVAPALIAGSARVARLIKGDLNTVKKHIEVMSEALCGGRKPVFKLPEKQLFEPQLIHADTDLTLLTERLKKLGRLNFSLCLYGVSGTGKSAYARYLAEQLNLKVIQRRASDLLDAFVGETEKNIASSFARAKEEKALLIFDEADSFLQDRSRAVRSWEVSHVNEMLTWMESHPYPFICTTNLMDHLDPASLRRFSFKVRYDFLTCRQVCQGFEFFFGVRVKEEQVSSLTRLTPGDFAVVKNKADILGVMKEEKELVNLLLSEQKSKFIKDKSSIGFIS